MTKATEAKKTKEVKKIPAEIEKLETKSAKIRALAAKGWSRGDIARVLGIKYQHVRNVLTTPLKKAKDA